MLSVYDMSYCIMFNLALGKWSRKIRLLLRFPTKDVVLLLQLLVEQMLVLCALKLNRNDYLSHLKITSFKSWKPRLPLVSDDVRTKIP